MSNFLRNLAARSLGAPTLRPRLRSRFEPAPAADLGIAFDAAAPGLPPLRVAQVDRTAETPRARVPDAVPAMPPPAGPPRISALLAIDTKRPADNDPIPPPAAAAVAVRRSDPVAPPPPRERAAAPAAVAPSRSMPARERVVTESIVETREIMVREPAVPAAASTPAMPPPALPRHRYDEQPPRIERTVVSRETTFAAPRFTRVPQPRTDLAEKSEPVIQVSIGRVEVRAVTPAPAKQNRAARAAAMTIDDYASRRNAKGRR